MEDGRMTEDQEPALTLDQAYRAANHFIHQYYLREPIVPFELTLHSMATWSKDGDLRETIDPTTWDDWMQSVRTALASDAIPQFGRTTYK
jgi:hypothetical protein